MKEIATYDYNEHPIFEILLKAMYQKIGDYNEDCIRMILAYKTWDNPIMRAIKDHNTSAKMMWRSVRFIQCRSNIRDEGDSGWFYGTWDWFNHEKVRINSSVMSNATKATELLSQLYGKIIVDKNNRSLLLEKAVNRRGYMGDNWFSDYNLKDTYGGFLKICVPKLKEINIYNNKIILCYDKKTYEKVKENTIFHGKTYGEEITFTILMSIALGLAGMERHKGIKEMTWAEGDFTFIRENTFSVFDGFEGGDKMIWDAFVGDIKKWLFTINAVKQYRVYRIQKEKFNNQHHNNESIVWRRQLDSKLDNFEARKRNWYDDEYSYEWLSKGDYEEWDTNKPFFNRSYTHDNRNGYRASRNYITEYNNLQNEEAAYRRYNSVHTMYKDCYTRTKIEGCVGCKHRQQKADLIERIEKKNNEKIGLYDKDKKMVKSVKLYPTIPYAKSWGIDRLLKALWNEGHEEHLKKYVKPKYKKVLNQMKKKRF